MDARLPLEPIWRTDSTRQLSCAAVIGSWAWQTGPMSDLSYSESITVKASPDALCAMISDVTRMGEWSPV